MQREKESIRNKVIRQFRRRAFQPLWQRMFRIAKVGMNYWNQSRYHNGELLYLKSVRNRWSEPITFFDVGANLGQYATLIHDVFQGRNLTVHCFEPSPVTFELLEEELKNLSQPALFVPHNFGFSASAGEAELFGDNETSEIRSLYKQRQPAKAFNDSVTKTIQLKTIDAFCKGNNIAQIHFLKIDVEGHELEVLKGATEMIKKGAIKSIQFEMNTCNMDSRVYFRDFYDLLSPEYTIYRLLPDGKWPIKEYHNDLEIVEYINFVAEWKE